MIENRADSAHNRHVVTVRCPACDAVKGEDYEIYSDHLYTEHTPADFGLTPLRDGNGQGAAA